MTTPRPPRLERPAAFGDVPDLDDGRSEEEIVLPHRVEPVARRVPRPARRSRGGAVWIAAAASLVLLACAFAAGATSVAAFAAWLLAG